VAATKRDIARNQDSSASISVSHLLPLGDDDLHVENPAANTGASLR
jgi:hypothetical protein